MKVVISKSGLYVREPKNINFSRTRQDMKKSKLGFCRMSSGFSFHEERSVNTCWPRMWKFCLKFKKSLKNAFFRRCGRHDGAFRQYGFCEYDIFFETLPRYVFSPKSKHIIIFWKFTKKYSLISKKLHFRRPSFNKHHYITKVIYKCCRDKRAQWLGLWASELTRVSSSPPHDTFFLLLHK